MEHRLKITIATLKRYTRHDYACPAKSNASPCDCGLTDSLISSGFELGKADQVINRASPLDGDFAPGAYERLLAKYTEQSAGLLALRQEFGKITGAYRKANDELVALGKRSPQQSFEDALLETKSNPRCGNCGHGLFQHAKPGPNQPANAERGACQEPDGDEDGCSCQAFQWPGSTLKGVVPMTPLEAAAEQARLEDVAADVEHLGPADVVADAEAELQRRRVAAAAVTICANCEHEANLHVRQGSCVGVRYPVDVDHSVPCDCKTFQRAVAP